MKKTIGLTIVFLFLWLGLPTPTPGQQVSLTILHTNDTHGHLLPFSYPNIVPSGSELSRLSARRDIGGIARRTTLVKRLRKELEARGTTVWFVDAGDFCDGTPLASEYRGEADVAAMNAAGYDFITLGNHEFNNSLVQLKKLISLFRFPVLCANAIEVSTGKPLTAPSVLRDLGRLKVGLFGLLIRGAGQYQAGKEGVTVTDELETAQRMVKTLRPEAGIVIALSHAGQETDEKIGSVVDGLDVIVGGHSHTRLPLGQFMWHSEELKANNVNGTVIVQAHQWAGELGRLDLLLSKDSQGAWHVDRYRARLLPITSDIPEDPEVAAVVDRFWKPIKDRFGEIIGQAADDFSDRGDDLAPYNLVADLVREYTGAEFVLENLGGVRAPLIKGAITRGDLMTLDPFDNKVVTFQMTGRQLKDLLQKSRPAVSGIRYRWENGVLTEVSMNGQPLRDDRSYSGASNSYYAGTAMKGIEVTNTGRVRLDVVIEMIRKKGTVAPSYDGRRIVVGRAPTAP